MEKLKTCLRDEWLSLKTGDRASADHEITGIVAGLAVQCENGSCRCTGNRLFVFRRLKKLWSLSRWMGKMDFGKLLSVPRAFKGSVGFKITENIYDEMLSVVSENNEKERLRWEWVRGLFGACGSLYLPKTGYFLVFRFPGTGTNPVSSEMETLFRSEKLRFHVRERNGSTEILLRDQQHISSVLSHMRLFRSSLILEEKALLRSLRDRANKIVNCDGANIRKSLEAASRQVSLGKFLMERGYLDQIPAKLREVIDVRLKNPSVTLRELGQMLSHPVSKSTIEYRWRKIEAYGRQLAPEDYEGG